MILRARALRAAGWFPTNSVTEDWALGMRLKKLKYMCRYVNVRNLPTLRSTPVCFSSTPVCL